jgi:hypothetical protein
VAGLFTALTPRDTIGLAGCDARLRLGLRKPAAAEPKNPGRHPYVSRQAAVAGLDEPRRRLRVGLQAVGPKTHIVYIGDGIVTTGDARPDGFASG